MVTAPATAWNASSATAAPVVACQKLTKVFKDFWMRDRVRAVDELSFDIRPREVFGLLGPNGSGKSTTIKMILGLLRPSRGRIAVFGKPPHEVDIKKRIGYLPEESYLYPFLNARETLDYYAKLFNLDAKTRTRRTDELLDMVGLTGAQFRPVREYSKGMQRRIGIAQALINDPDFLILDEPTTGLDPIGTKQVKDLIIELGRRGKTILLSSHLLSDVEDCVHRMVILYGGRVRRYRGRGPRGAGGGAKREGPTCARPSVRGSRDRSPRASRRQACPPRSRSCSGSPGAARRFPRRGR
ncbi:MAG: ABC transporter ATP-binding protein, partial [Phycisphaerales bacterium]|nr:ABC transporter ATP-binding protein [Phycisphaerales bacterium]